MWGPAGPVCLYRLSKFKKGLNPFPQQNKSSVLSLIPVGVSSMFPLLSLPQSLFSVTDLVRTVECAWASTGAAVPKALLEVSVKSVSLCVCVCVCARACVRACVRKTFLCLHFVLRLLLCVLSVAVTTPCVPPCQHGATCSPHNTCTCPEGTAGLRCERL